MAGEQYISWDPTKNVTNVGGHTVRGFADGEMISVEFTVDQNTMHIGTDGQGRHLESADKSGQITIRVSSYSPSNAAFQALYLTKKPFAIASVDKSSNGDSFFAASCKLSKIPTYVKGAEETVNEYVFNFIEGKVIRAGAEATSLLDLVTDLVGG